VTGVIPLPPCGGGLGWGVNRALALQRCVDFLDDTRKIAEHIVVPKPEHPIAALAQESRSLIVVCKTFRMLSAVDFDDQTVLETDEVRDIRPKRNLTAKSRADLMVAQRSPEGSFGVGHIPTQVTGSFIRHGGFTPHPDPPPQGGRG
jgi:hypothetical protein